MANVKVTKKQAEKVLKNRAETITEDDLPKVLDRQRDLEEKFLTNGPLKRYIEDFKLLLALVRDYINGNYREVPWWSISAIIAALLYVLNPIDLIPDFIPFIGLVDDAFVLAACLTMIETDLQAYKAWKTKNG